MAGAAAAETQKSSRQGEKVGAPQQRRAPSVFRTLTVVVVGAVVTGLLAAAVIIPRQIESESKSLGGTEPTLAKVAAVELDSAVVTLDPATSQQAVADAKACKAPIAWVTLTKQPGTAGGSVRIRSGPYLSPPFHVTDVPQRIAIPYPAPYETGHGVLWAIGEGGGLAVDLYPRWNIPSLNGATAINVVWTPTDPC
jgi:hypothetical protein